MLGLPYLPVVQQNLTYNNSWIHIRKGGSPGGKGQKPLCRATGEKAVVHGDGREGRGVGRRERRPRCKVTPGQAAVDATPGKAVVQGVESVVGITSMVYL